MKNPIIPMKCSAIKSMRNTMGVGSFRECPTIRGLRKYHSNAWIMNNILSTLTIMLHPGYSTMPAKRIGMPPINTQRIGTKLVKNVIAPRANI